MKSLFSVALALLLTTALSAQTAEEIIAKHIEAIGGKDVLTKTTSLIAETSTSVMGNDAPGKIYILNGKGYKSETEMMGNKAIQCITAKSGWASNPMSGEITDIPEAQLSNSLSRMYLDGGLLEYAAKGTTVELIGKDKIDGKEAFKMKITPKGGTPVETYIDATTYYITRVVIKMEMMGQEIEAKMNYTNYKKLENGLVMAHAIEMDLGQFQLTTTLTKIELNKTIEESIFEKGK